MSATRTPIWRCSSGRPDTGIDAFSKTCAFSMVIKKAAHQCGEQLLLCVFLLLVLQVEESVLAEVLCNVLAQLFFDAEQLVVLRNTVGTARCTGLDLAGIERNRDVRDGRVLGLARTVGNNSG